MKNNPAAQLNQPRQHVLPQQKMVYQSPANHQTYGSHQVHSLHPQQQQQQHPQQMTPTHQSHPQQQQQQMPLHQGHPQQQHPSHSHTQPHPSSQHTPHPQQHSSHTLPTHSQTHPSHQISSHTQQHPSQQHNIQQQHPQQHTIQQHPQHLPPQIQSSGHVPQYNSGGHYNQNIPQHMRQPMQQASPLSATVPNNQPSHIVPYNPISRINDLFEALRHEFESLSEAATMYKLQRDEYEHKLNLQINEFSAFQSTLFELERAHQKMKIQYEDEISRLTRRTGGDMDHRSGSGLIGDASLPSGEPHGFIKRTRPEDQHQQGHPPIHKVQKVDNDAFQRVAQQARSAPLPHSSSYDLEDTKEPQQDWGVAYNPNPTTPHDKINIQLVHTIEHDSVVCCIRFSGCGKYLATGCNRYAQLFDVSTGQKICVLDDSTARDFTLYIRSVAFSPDSRLLATGVEDNVIRVWDIAKRSIVFPLAGHTHDIYSLEWSKDGRFLVSGSGDGTIRVWDIETAQNVTVISNESDHPVPSPSPSPERGVTSITINPVHAKCVAAGCLDKYVRIWDLSTGKLLEKLKGHTDSVYSVAFSPDGRSIVSGSLDRQVKVWDLSPQTLNFLATSNGDEQAISQTQLNTTCRYTFVGHKDYVLSVAFAGLSSSLGRVDYKGDPLPAQDLPSDIEWIVSGSKDRLVTFWDGGRGREVPHDMNSAPLFSLQGHKNSVISLSVSPIGGLIATGSGDSRARIWRVYRGTGMNHSGNHPSVGSISGQSIGINTSQINVSNGVRGTSISPQNINSPISINTTSMNTNYETMSGPMSAHQDRSFEPSTSKPTEIHAPQYVPSEPVEVMLGEEEHGEDYEELSVREDEIENEEFNNDEAEIREERGKSVPESVNSVSSDSV